jgi:hypothetical protein
MHDTELEQRLRMTLREEADRLPLRVEVEQLEALVVTRRRATRSSRFGLLAAAIGVVAFGIAAVGLNGGLPAGILPGFGLAPDPCTSLAVSDVQTPPDILLVDAAGVTHRGGLDNYRMPGSSTVHLRGMPGGESRLDPRTTSIEVTTAEGVCLLAVELRVVPPRDGASPEFTERAESLEGPGTSFSVSAPLPGKWRATLHATFQTTSGEMAYSTTIFRLVSTAPGSTESVAPTPSARRFPAGLVPIERRPDSAVLLEVPRTWSGPGTRHVVERPDSTTTIATVWVACIDESVTVDAEGVVEGLAHITVTADQPVEMSCMGEQPQAVSPTLTDQPTPIEISVPADVAYTVLVETVPVPAALPDIQPMFGSAEVDRTSENDMPDWSAEPATQRIVLGTLDEGFSQEATIVCLGPGHMSVQFQVPGATAPASSGGGFACTGEPQSLSISVGNRGPHDVVIEVDTRTAWHVVAGSEGTLPPFDAPGVYVTSWLGKTDVAGTVANPEPGCGGAYVVGGVSHGPDQCGPPEWSDVSDLLPLIARPGGELQVRTDEGWRWDEATVRAAPFLQTGKDEPPVNIRDLAASVKDGVLVVPLDLSTSKWVIRIDATLTNGDREYHAPLYFSVDVQP